MFISYHSNEMSIMVLVHLNIHYYNYYDYRIVIFILNQFIFIFEIDFILLYVRCNKRTQKIYCNIMPRQT